MTPSELTTTLARINERIRSALTGASSLVCLVLVTLVAAFVLHRVPSGMAKTIVVLALAGAAGLLAACRFFAWQRQELYDDVVLSGFRHIHGPAVARRAAELVSRTRRQQMADTLDRFVEAAVENQPTPVPVHRGALIELQPKVHQISTILRTHEVELEPAGMVLLGRFVTDGSSSPLFRVNADPRELEHELERIRRVLPRDGDDEQLAA
jgi:hypothetical protein